MVPPKLNPVTIVFPVGMLYLFVKFVISAAMNAASSESVPVAFQALSMNE
jgi:hypothetical protein